MKMIEINPLKCFQIAPAHYPCGPAVAGQNMEVGPHIGWANAIPDAASTVELTINGTKLAFAGTGYHDKVRYKLPHRFT
jgi:hypothetical protein